MTQEWCPFAVYYPGPALKQGYPVWGLGPAKKSGEVKHDAGGSSWDALHGELNGPVQKSWQFTIGPDRLEQHYPLSACCWHCGDTDPSDGVRGNIDFVGVEHLRVGSSLSSFQIDMTVKLSQWMALQFGVYIFERYPIIAAGSIWTMAEHNEMSATQCPSGRIPWSTILDNLNQPLLIPAPLEIDALRAINRVAAYYSTGGDLQEVKDTDKQIFKWFVQEMYL